MKVLVTGSSGFIGRHLCHALRQRDYEVVGVDIRGPAPELTGIDQRTIDLLDADALIATFQTTRPGAVVHLAARTDLDGRTIGEYAANTIGVENLIAAIASTPEVRRCVCTSSQLVCAVGHVPRSDTDYAPATRYGESKVITETVWRAADGAGSEWCLVRPTTIWGPGMSAHYLRFFTLLRRGRYVHIGSAPLRKSYGYVGNTVHQYIALLERPVADVHHRTFYLADYAPVSLRGWIDAFARALDAPTVRTVPVWLARVGATAGDAVNRIGIADVPFTTFRLNNILTSYTFDLSETERVCGPLPYDLADGVRATAAWVREQTTNARTPKSRGRLRAAGLR